MIASAELKSVTSAAIAHKISASLKASAIILDALSASGNVKFSFSPKNPIKMLFNVKSSCVPKF